MAMQFTVSNGIRPGDRLALSAAVFAPLPLHAASAKATGQGGSGVASGNGCKMQMPERNCNNPGFIHNFHRQ